MWESIELQRKCQIDLNIDWDELNMNTFKIYGEFSLQFFTYWSNFVIKISIRPEIWTMDTPRNSPKYPPTSASSSSIVYE